MKYGLIGSSGRMGLEIQSVFKKHMLSLTLDEEKEWLGGPPDVIVDFSSCNVTPRTIELCRENHSGLVIGTTALSAEQLEMLRELGKTVPVVQSFNFSMGINILKMIIREFSPYLQNWDMEMAESHHVKKKDAPSGTAILLRDATGRDCNISSLRLGGIPGDHSVLFANEGEVIEFSHRALSRRVFALGALKAAEFVSERERGFYSFEEVLSCELKK